LSDIAVFFEVLSSCLCRCPSPPTVAVEGIVVVLSVNCCANTNNLLFTLPVMTELTFVGI